MPPRPVHPEATDSASAIRSREQEWKRSRGAIACAECRRLKLKCDKSVPCASCKRRGCASICPNGSLVTGQGTRFVLADTDRLHNKITDMSDRIRQLEDALAVSHFSISRDPHPLLQRDLLKIKSIIDLHSAAAQKGDSEGADERDASQTLDVFGTLALRDDGGSTFYGRSAGQENEQDSPTNSPSPGGGGGEASNSSVSSGASPGLPRSILEVSSAFPEASIRLPLYALEAYLPPWSRASQLCTLYVEQAPWFFGAVKERQLQEELLPLYYVEARPPNAPYPAAPTAHDLALLFVVFCFGALTDDALPPAPANADSERFHILTRAALALVPPTDRPPSVTTVQTLSTLAIYQGLVANEHSIESTWALMGLATKLAQSVHRDCARWNLTPSETQKRRALFWELFITDCWQSLATGRLPTFSLPFVDCELPQDLEQLMTANGTPVASFPHWKAQFGKQCVSEVVAGILTARPPKYSVIIDLDRRIRDMELPQYALEPPPDGASFSVVMQHFMPSNYHHLTLLYVHRTFLAQGLCDHPVDPMRGTYAPSIMSGYRSACEILSNLRTAFNLFPARVARFWVLWTHGFSAAVTLALVPVRAPQSKMAKGALTELQAAYELFDRAAPYGGRAVKMLPVVRRHLEKATESFHAVQASLEPFAAPQRDEFAVFSGATSTIRAPASGSPSLRLSPSAPMTESSPSPSQPLYGTSPGSFSQPSPPSQPPPPPLPPLQSTIAELDQPPPWSQAHPALVDQLASFEAQIAPLPPVAGHVRTYELQYESMAPQTPHTPHTPYSYPTPASSTSSSSLAYHPPQHQPREQRYPDSSMPLSATPDEMSAGADPRWAVPHTESQHHFVRPRSPPRAYAGDRVLRQSGDLSLTEAWSQFMMQMDVAPPGPRPPS
ncbi:hypothetical protein BC834DRAFT_1013816 [Gloeopeniophorella convolvens]|nr:hypothetical protein BC834DRAFT_1013816 [Gloeopeniophorella convolvens]